MNHSEILQHLKEAGYDEKRLNFVLQAVAAYEETPTQESANYLAEHLVEFGTVEQILTIIEDRWDDAIGSLTDTYSEEEYVHRFLDNPQLDPSPRINPGDSFLGC